MQFIKLNLLQQSMKFIFLNHFMFPFELLMPYRKKVRKYYSLTNCQTEFYLILFLYLLFEIRGRLIIITQIFATKDKFFQ